MATETLNFVQRHEGGGLANKTSEKRRVQAKGTARVETLRREHA